MSEFDLARARNGDSVEINFCDVWCDVHFVGATADGKRAVFQYKDGLFSRWLDDESVRMKPKQREMWCFPYKDDIAGTIRMSRLFDMKESAEDAPAFHLKRAGEIQMILVDEE